MNMKEERKIIIRRLFDSLILPRYPWMKKIGEIKKDGPFGPYGGNGVYINIVIGRATMSEVLAARKDFENILQAASLDKDDNGNKISYNFNWTGK